MSISNERYEQFLQYLNGQLDTEGRQAVEQIIANDPALQQEFLELKNIHELTIAHGLIETEAKLKEMDLTQFDQPKNRAWLYGGGLLLLIGGFITWSLAVMNDSPSESSHVSEKRDTSTLLKTTASDQPASIEDDPTVPKTTKNKTTHPTKAQQKAAPIGLIDTSRLATSNLKPDTSLMTELPEKKAPVARDTVKEENTAQQIESPCLQATIQAKIQTQASCLDDANGSITVGNPTGGTPPYRYVLGSGLPSRDYSFHDLTPDLYSITIIDSQGCQVELSAEVDEKTCKSEQETAAFNPQNGESFTLPVPQGERGLLTIFNSSGQLVLQREVTEGAFWDGSDSNGSLLPTDHYSYLLKLDNQVIQGEVAIINF